MNIRDFTPQDYPSIVAIHNSQNIRWPERPRTPEALAEADSRLSEKSMQRRWVGVEDGRVVGFACYAQHPWTYPSQSFYVTVEVDPAYQRRGIGSALYDRVMEGLQVFDPPSLRADAFANLPRGFAFLQRRGFYEAFRETPVHLEVSTFDPAPYVDLEPSLRAQGFVIKTLRELEKDPNRDRKLYHLYWEINEDVPHEGELTGKPGFEEWLDWGLHDAALLLEAYFIAVCGDLYVGLRELGRYPGSDMLLGGLLGVRRDHRNRGIGLAMQLRGIQYARDHGIPLLKTCTAIQNTPMQALFNKLGYIRDPEWQQCQRDLQ